MARRISSSQLRSQLRQIQHKRQQAVNRHNQAVRQYNQNLNRAINKHNQEVRAHNARVRANRQKLTTALNHLKSLSSQTTTRYPTYRVSVTTLHERHTQFEQYSAPQYEGTANEQIIDLVDNENANNIDVMNALLADDDTVADNQTGFPDTYITDELSQISPDLNARWRGAIYALHPSNPDAARHFCTSAREIFTEILESKAPDDQVLTLLPNCDRTGNGKPTRKAKIHFFMHRRGLHDNHLEDFVDADIENIIELFGLFNSGTHGQAGKFSYRQLVSIKRRVEDGISFLARIAG